MLAMPIQVLCMAGRGLKLECPSESPGGLYRTLTTEPVFSF
jgi:hypothetical protein